ncbi:MULTISPECIES: hypothetical protein [Pseudomonas]|uniref:Uncharacterized protein n=1 Tax=Pseudomonas fluorescens ICMP 11288 TaxID=1198309 RepID=A0A0W0HVP6_PSEFL|nr:MULTISPECIES: hypothetical protein [Pseudomonas]KTB64684.1 hypothetical protein AO063_02580 [Pseudomonas fluorescens ICMP 11288]
MATESSFKGSATLKVTYKGKPHLDFDLDKVEGAANNFVAFDKDGKTILSIVYPRDVEDGETYPFEYPASHAWGLQFYGDGDARGLDGKVTVVASDDGDHQTITIDAKYQKVAGKEYVFKGSAVIQYIP